MWLHRLQWSTRPWPQKVTATSCPPALQQGSLETWPYTRFRQKQPQRGWSCCGSELLHPPATPPALHTQLANPRMEHDEKEQDQTKEAQGLWHCHWPEGAPRHQPLSAGQLQTAQKGALSPKGEGSASIHSPSKQRMERGGGGFQGKDPANQKPLKKFLAPGGKEGGGKKALVLEVEPV